MSVFKELDSEEMMCGVHKILGAELKALFDQWSDLDHLEVLSKVDCLTNVIMNDDACKELLTTFASY